MKSVLFMRHGLASRAAGIYDDEDQVHLSQDGCSQIVLQRPYVTRYGADRVIVSPLPRCMQTLEALGDGVHCEATVDERLRERSFPGLFGRTFESIALQHGEEVAHNLRTHAELVDLAGSETLEQAQARVVEAIRDGLFGAIERLLVISHGGPHSWLVCWIAGMPLSSLRRITLGEGCFSQFEFTREGLPLRIQRLNDPGYLTRRP